MHLDIEKKRLTAIKENEEFAKKLGLPVKKRKFERHVLRTDPPSIAEDEDNDTEDSEHSEAEIPLLKRESSLMVKRCTFM